MGPSIEELRVWLCNWLAAKLETRPDTIGIRERFTRYGLSSLDMARMVADLSTKVGSPLSPLLAFDHPTIEALARHVAASGDSRSPTKASAQGVSVADDEPVAIIGIGCRLPKAPSKEAFWQLLCDRRDAITEVPADRWNAAAFYDPSPGVPGRMITRWGGFLDQIDQFDPSFFGISPREATYMDPQQRLLLELSWEALEDAGIVAEKLSGSRTGVYVSTIWTDYVAVLYGAGAEKIGPYTVTGHHSSILANRISYTLGLRGPGTAIDAACASGVVALHLAFRACAAVNRPWRW